MWRTLGSGKRTTCLAAFAAACVMFAPQLSAAVLSPTLSAAAGDGSVQLRWTSVPDAAHYEWRMSSDGGNTWRRWSHLPNSGVGTSDYTVTDLTNETAYTFQVRAKITVWDNETGTFDLAEGPSSNSVTTTPTPGASTAGCRYVDGSLVCG